MKRQIKFRGKSLNGQWAYGSLIKFDIGYVILTNEKTVTDSELGVENCIVFSDEEIEAVTPDSIGQFTGLFDKNGKEIYEGDVLSFITERKMGFRKDGVEILFSVVFGRANPDNDTTSEYIGFWAEGESGCRSSIAYRIRSNGAKVIGNIHDNNELLKGGKE